MLDRLYENLTSTKFALALFGVLSPLSILGTPPGFDPIYGTLFFRTLLGLLGLCTFLCSFSKWKVMR